MKGHFKFYSSWDTLVFFLITAVGLIFSLQRMTSPRGQAIAAVSSSDGTMMITGNRHVIDLGCIDKNPVVAPIANSGAKLRLKGRLCEGAGPRVIRNLTVSNLSNGLETTVFQSVRNSFMTDALRLNQGRNAIRVHWAGENDSTLSAIDLEIYHR